MKKKIFLLFIFIIQFFICDTVIFAQENNDETKYIASISSDFENGENLKFQMRTEKEFSTGGYSIEFRHEDYGHFHTFAPYIESPSTPIVTMGCLPAHGNLSLKKNDNYHFIFFLGKESEEIKEEFLINIENGIIKVKTLSDTKIIVFEPVEIYIFPENTLTIIMHEGLTIDNAVKEKLKKNGCKPLVLPSGDYGWYEILGYSDSDKYAHKTSRNENEFYYFYGVKDKYEKIENILKENKVSKESTVARYRHSYNFDIKKRIEYEKNPGFSTVEMKEIPNEIREIPNMQSQRSLDAIIFHLEKPASVTVRITNKEGKTIEEIKMSIEAAGTVSYKWDGILKDGTKAEKGVYLYHVFSGEETIRSGMFVIK